MKPVTELDNSAVLVKPVDFDFGKGYTETWDTITPSTDTLTLAECKDIIEEAGNDLPDPNPWKMSRQELFDLLDYHGLMPGDDEDEKTLRDWVIEEIENENIDGISDYQRAAQDTLSDNPDRWSPMMNYYYPLPGYNGDTTEDQLLLDSKTPLVLVEIDGETVMGLSGGGMDFSWDICFAYMLLGYLPPLHFADLPRMADRPRGDRDKWIIEGCMRSAELAASWAEATREKLHRMLCVAVVTEALAK